MSRSGNRTRQRQLAKNAKKRQQTRAMEQRRRRLRIAAVLGAFGLVVAIVGSLVLFRPASTPAARPSKSAFVSPSGSPAPKPGTQTGTVSMKGSPPAVVACGASLPPEAGKPKPQFSGPPKQTIDPTATYTAIIQTSCGEIQIALDPAGAPVATNSFVFLADKHFYDGIWFHRIVKGFMIQGGDPLGTGGLGGPGYEFNTEVNQTIKFGDTVGVLAYGNSGPNTNGSQFFITVAKQSFLDTNGPYTAFGTVTKGLDVLKKISDLPATTAPTGCAGATEACRTTQAVYIDSIAIKVTKPKPSPSPSP